MSSSLGTALEVTETDSLGSFPLVARQQAATLLVDPDESLVVRQVATAAFAADIERVTGVMPAVKELQRFEAGRPVVVIGTIGQSELIRQLSEAGLLDTADLEGKWESFKVIPLRDPESNRANTLVIVGSDRRGTAYGVFEVSRAIGVSPWYWWADVPTKKQSSLHLSSSGKRVGPPSVKYRGIFLNDEDWGLQPWAAKTYEQETGDIGPKTYAAIFELLLRLKANHIWPAMHPSTRAFNYYPENKVVADRYAIVMGSSHAEPMLRNNVDEWRRDGKGEWNFLANEQNVLNYWDTRVAENAQFENVYTVGMRGIHDSAMQGAGTLEQRARTLERIISEQREMLHRHTGRAADEIPQVFIPYKEVLTLYRSGLTVPEDVSLVWANDNYGYIRQLSNAKERQRSGGSGVYYHYSYWGSPHDYLWLCTTPPALVWEEMTKAYAYGADRNWIVNVGDFKPTEIGAEWFLRLAWDVEQYGPLDARKYLVEFSEENFETNRAEDIADILHEFYLLNFVRKPEHMGWTTVHPNTSVSDTEFSHWAHGDESQRRLDKFEQLQSRAESIAADLPEKYYAAFFQLVLYPVRSAANMNRKILYAEKSRYEAMEGHPVANSYANQARAAYAQIQKDTETYNAISSGKWRHIMSLNPRKLPVFGPPDVVEIPVDGAPTLAVRVEGSSKMATSVVEDQTVLPEIKLAVHLGVEAAKVFGPMRISESGDGPCLSLPQGSKDLVQGEQGQARAVFAFEIKREGTYAIEMEVNHPTDKSDSWFIRVDDFESTLVNDHQTGGTFDWLRASVVPLSPGQHRLTITARENGAQLRRVRLVPRGMPPAYTSPALNGDPNRLPTLNALRPRNAFVDLYNLGSGSVNWKIESSNDWIKLSKQQGKFEQHDRISLEIDHMLAPREESLEGEITISSDLQTYVVKVPVLQPTVAISPGTHIQENGCISIDAEQFDAQNPSQDGSVSWKVIDGVGYSGAVVGLFPRLIDAELPLVPGSNSPSLEYPLHVFEGGEATITFQALPTHEINESHALELAFSVDGSDPRVVRFSQGNSEHNQTWQRNVLRGAMTGSARMHLAEGTRNLRVHGLDPSVVLDRIVITFGQGSAPAYLGPRSTRVSAVRMLDE